MSAILYGALQLSKSPVNEDNYCYDAIGKNSEIFTGGDIVSIDATNGLKVAVAQGAIAGVVAKTVTMASDNQTVAKVSPAFTPIDLDYEFLMGTNSDLTPITSIGDTYQIVGTTGVQQVDVNTGIVVPGSGGQVEITKVDPLNIGGTGSGSGLRQCYVKFVKLVNNRTA